MGGRLTHFKEFWASMECSQWAKDIVSVGYYIPFHTLPRPTGIRETPLRGVFSQVLLEEVATLSLKGAIEPVQGDRTQGCYWTYFLVPKKTGDLRPILNLKPMNQFVSNQTFKMETLESVARGIRPGD